MDVRLKVFLFVFVVAFTMMIFSLLKRRLLKVKYSVLWLFMSFVLLLTLLFSETVKKISKFAGFETTSNFIYFIAIFFILIMLVSLCVIISKQSETIKTLTQKLGILGKEVHQSKDEKNDGKQ